MAKRILKKQNKCDAHCKCCDNDSIDINEKLTNFVSYIKNSDDCLMILKLSKTEQV